MACPKRNLRLSPPVDIRKKELLFENSRPDGVVYDYEQDDRVQPLENDSDRLYETHGERLAERDTEFGVREARRIDKRHVDWSDIGKSGAQEKTEEEGEGGSWTRTRWSSSGLKGDDSDSSTDTEDETSLPQLAKRKQPDQQGTPGRRHECQALWKSPKLYPTMKKKTAPWFSKEIFK
ncbi:hypothetical protein BJY52DRAFT_1222520 [Lactarius psammicola]|nr:hypothetical protein BJY52DRAFT_1222520 [Lactarius psammicola]